MNINVVFFKNKDDSNKQQFFFSGMVTIFMLLCVFYMYTFYSLKSTYGINSTYLLLYHQTNQPAKATNNQPNKPRNQTDQPERVNCCSGHEKKVEQSNLIPSLFISFVGRKECTWPLGVIAASTCTRKRDVEGRKKEKRKTMDREE